MCCCAASSPHPQKPTTMKNSLAIIVVAFLAASSVDAREFITTYNLIASPETVHPSFHAGGLIAPGIIAAPQSEPDLAHPAVVENAIAESQLPQELLNPFYKNPAIAAGLAKESWFTNKEFPVHHREADKIPRSEIAKIINRILHQRRRR